jgi:hypothetical protein
MPWLRVRPQLGKNIQDAQENKIQCTIINVLTVPRMQQHNDVAFFVLTAESMKLTVLLHIV